ncbi:hypothetical protein [Corynebacterium amycolatum]|uniref:Uncharacterized protein n=1 Tax=Corynebacterium amycolatum TaxID=43765 RepID=A0AB38XUD6_CORAY|nr:hypothetical protein [Corynebacterium amycolatum]QRP15808.1 hypothetical protein I6J19_06305 [Corynebacterium amycolatum]WET43642.1 hypothetical protein P2W56_09480 [Corynebacterium amycolatum]
MCQLVACGSSPRPAVGYTYATARGRSHTYRATPLPRALAHATFGRSRALAPALCSRLVAAHVHYGSAWLGSGGRKHFRQLHNENT